jgi:hypothetical protein
MVECWYNTNYHSAIKTTPFEALYGYSPLQLPMGTVPKGCNAAVNEVIVDRQATMKVMKEHLLKAK